MTDAGQGSGGRDVAKEGASQRWRGLGFGIGTTLVLSVIYLASWYGHDARPEGQSAPTSAAPTTEQATARAAAEQQARAAAQAEQAARAQAAVASQAAAQAAAQAQAQKLAAERAHAEAAAAALEAKKCKEFISTSADGVLGAQLNSASPEETWDKRFAQKCVRWRMKFKAVGFVQGFYASAGQRVDIDCDLLDLKTLDDLRGLDKWAPITVEGRLDALNKEAGTLRGTIELEDCVVVKR